MASKLASTWVPKTGPKSTQNLEKSSGNLYNPTRRSRNGSEPRQTFKNKPKSSKRVPTWPHHGPHILTKSMPKASPGRDFLGTRQYSNMCNNRLPQQQLGCIMGPKDFHMGRSAQQLQQSVRDLASQRATTQCIHFHFSTIACMHMVSESFWKHKGRSLLSNSSDSSHQSPSTGPTRQHLRIDLLNHDCLCLLP